ncbi:nucleoside triphosphate pyrophosphohydrolase family protein [Cytobacillus firmus]|uniref:nucleoside triphosphate pyrophosphohydrolase family protein n=1 Tax=Cytobacillus firmus TaxID=1399 RepID=UPI002E218C9C
MSYKQEIIRTIEKLIDTQNEKGLKKYGHTLEDCDPGEYNWGQMIIEELIDALQYQQKEIHRLQFATDMTLNQFQELSKRTQPVAKTTDDFKKNLSNYAMGLAGEAGEVIDALKKTIYHGHELDRMEVMKELGDVLHYISGLATMLDIELENVARANIVKLQKRYPNGFNKEDSINRTE